MLLKQLCDLPGAPGNEDKVREFIKTTVEPWCDEVIIDRLGSVVATKKCKDPAAKTVMLDAHMDEVGFMIIYITDDGLLSYAPLGGLDPRVLVSKRVKIGANSVPGVIGAKAIHLQSAADRNTAPTHDNLYIDIGCRDKASAEKLVKIGDYAVFDSDIVEFGDGLMKAKALDDRVGCAVMIEMLRDGDFPVNLVCSFSVQEEVGMRGATVTAHRIAPDVALALEATGANDVAEVEAHERITCLHKGPAISFMDNATIHTPSLFRALCRIGKEAGVTYQVKNYMAGGNNAGAMQRARGGAASVTISLPARYIHSPSSVCAYEDYLSMIELVRAYLKAGAPLDE